MNDVVLLVISVLVILYVFGRRLLIMLNPNVKNVTSEAATQLLAESDEVLILDVRTKEEYDRGHLPGARLLPVQELAARISELDNYTDTPVLVYCASGGRSPGAINTLLRHNFSNIYHLYRGIYLWTLPLER